ncbi:MAG: Cytochrome P450, partial [uncultured Actinomycetospora sp.]
VRCPHRDGRAPVVRGAHAHAARRGPPAPRADAPATGAAAGRAARGQRAAAGAGRRGAAGAGAHAVLHPLRPRLHPRPARGARAGVVVRVRGRARGDRRRPRRHARGAHESREGLLPGRLALPRRRLLPPRADVARRRRPPRAPPGHAGGVHRRPGARLRRPHRPRAARDDPGVADRSAGAHLPDAQAADPRRRHPRVHGRTLRAGGRGGQRRVHGVRAGGQRHRPARPARHPLPRGAAGPRAARALLHRGAAGEAGGRRRRPVLRALPGPHTRGRGVQRRRRRQPHDLPDDGRARHLDDHQCGRRPLPRREPGVAGARPVRVAGAGRRPAGRGGAAVAAHVGPGDEGVAAPRRARARRDAPDGPRHRAPGSPPARGAARHGRGRGEPPRPGDLVRPRRLRPRALRRAPPRGQGPPRRVDPLRRRGAQVPGHAVRVAGGDGDPPRAAAPPPHHRRARLPAALGQHLAARPRRRAPPAPRAPAHV